MMPKSQPLSSLLLAGIAFASSACSSGGTTDKVINLDSSTATMGANGVGGSGAVQSTGSPVMGNTGDPAGSVSVGGAGNTGVTSSTSSAGVTSSTVSSSTSGAAVTSSTGSGTGGTGGAGVTSSTGSSTGGSTGVTGTTGGAGGTGGTGGEDPNKIVLFDGSDESFNNWISVRNGGANPWQNNGDGTMTVQTNTGDIISEQTFQDVFVHLEYVTPRITSAGGGQERGNSGVYLKGSYEVQILDTYGLEAANDGCGAIYGISPPLVVACNQEEVWNTYEIEFRANACNNGQKTASANFVEVKLNDIVVQQDVTVDGTTQAGQPESCEPKGLLLQDHPSILPVSFRNIWVIPRN